MVKDRYCCKCEKVIPHDVMPHTCTGEKVFVGVATLGLIPLFEAMTRAAPSGPGFYAKVTTCQRCGLKRVFDLGQEYE